MIGAQFITNGQRIPVIVTGHKHGLVEVFCIKHSPFTEYGYFNDTHKVKRGYVKKSDLVNLRSTRINDIYGGRNEQK